jgi:hypothetical protein
VPLADLSPELQATYNFDPTKATEHALGAEQERQRLAAEQLKRQQTAASARPKAAAETATTVDRAARKFGTPNKTGTVDLRPLFKEYHLPPPDQGATPSCAVHTVLGAVEFANAKVTTKPEKFSAAYGVWATSKVVGLKFGEKRLLSTVNGTEAEARPAVDDHSDWPDPANPELGYSVAEVVSGIRAYGLELAANTPLPVGPGLRGRNLLRTEPTPERIEAARKSRRIAMQTVPGGSPAACLRNMMHLLDEGVPIVIGLQWPHWRTIRAGNIAEQTPLPDGSHSVLLVGYRNTTDNPEDIRFIFRNSWGPTWGVGGYGTISFNYLERNLLDAIVVEILPTPAG